MPTRVTSDDADFLAGLNMTVAVWEDTNKTGGQRSDLGGAGPNYQPVSGYGSEACHIKFGKPKNYNAEDRPGAVAFGRVLFGVSVDLDLNHKLVWADPGTGKTRHLYVEGRSQNAHEQNHHWVVDFTEYVA